MQLCFDFNKLSVMAVSSPGTGLNKPAFPAVRKAQGKAAYQAGLLAEAAVADYYSAAGYNLVRRRWRGRGGEVDLILQKDVTFIFTEVKFSKRFSRAAESLNRRQMDRICIAACEFCASLPTGQMTDMRMDVALVDQYGRIEIIENAFEAH